MQCLQGMDEQQVAGDDFRAIRPTYNHKLNWTAGHSAFELSLSDADTTPCEVLVSSWDQADEQKWKIVPADSRPAALVQARSDGQPLFSIRVRRREGQFGLSLEDGRLVLRPVLPGSPEQSWKVCAFLDKFGLQEQELVLNVDVHLCLLRKTHVYVRVLVCLPQT